MLHGSFIQWGFMLCKPSPTSSTQGWQQWVTEPCLETIEIRHLARDRNSTKLAKLWSSPSRKTERGSERCFIKWRCHFIDYIASLVIERITSTEDWWNDTRETRSSRRKPCPSVTLFPTNNTWAGLGSSPCLRCERPALTAWDKARPLFVLFCLQDRPTHHLSRMMYLLLFLNQSRLIQW
jgi:hypothetical protein